MAPKLANKSEGKVRWGRHLRGRKGAKRSGLRRYRQGLKARGGIPFKKVKAAAKNPKVMVEVEYVKDVQIAATAKAAPMEDVKPALSIRQDHETELVEKLVAEVVDTSPDVNALCETYELRREELGRLTGFSLRALAEWASGKLPSQPAKRRLQEVRRLLDALAEIVKRESITKWLHQPNEAFDRLTPLQVIELGEIDRLWAMVHEMGSGQPD